MTFNHLIKPIKQFFGLEIAGGVVLAFFALLAMVVANSPLSGWYQHWLHLPIVIQVGSFTIQKDLHHLINDGLMAIFFFLVGLELKRESLIGELANVRQIVLPALCALGGMVVPALVYVALNHNNDAYLKGWAIPTATDIAFALGVLSLLGSRIPNALKVFLVSIAIFDDLGAIAIIALFYTAELSVSALVVAGLCFPMLLLFNRINVTRFTPYLIVGLILWVSLLQSGIHATLAGVLLAMFIPLTDNKDAEHSPLEDLEHDLHNTVAFGVLPIFAFANAGIVLTGMGIGDLFHSVPAGVTLGLFLGKQLGIMMAVMIALKMNLATLPKHTTLAQVYGVACLCGIGFTMSLFVSGLAFGGVPADFDPRLGIMVGSLLAGIVGYLVLRKSTQGQIVLEDFDDEGYIKKSEN